MIAGGIEKMKYRLSKRDQKSDIPPKPVIFVNTERERHRLATGEARRGGMRNPGFLFFVILEESFHLIWKSVAHLSGDLSHRMLPNQE